MYLNQKFLSAFWVDIYLEPVLLHFVEIFLATATHVVQYIEDDVSLEQSRIWLNKVVMMTVMS